MSTNTDETKDEVLKEVEKKKEVNGTVDINEEDSAKTAAASSTSGGDSKNGKDVEKEKIEDEDEDEDEDDGTLDYNFYCREIFADYLCKNGYKKAFKAFQEETGSTPIRGSSSTVDCAEAISLQTSYKEREEGIYYSEYKRFHEWALESLIVHRDEFLEICYPLFVVAFAKTMGEGQKEKALRMLDTYGGDFLRSHRHDIREMKLCVSIDAARNSDFLKTFLRKKHCVQLSSHHVLLQCLDYLKASRLDLLWFSLCRHVKLTPSSRNNSDDGRRHERASIAASLVGGDPLEIPAKRRHVAEKRGCDPSLYVSYDENSKVSWKFDDEESKLPVGGARSNRELESLSAGKLPSAICFTALNGRSVGISSMITSEDGSLIVAATEMSTVRVWDLAHRRKKASSDVSNSHELVGHGGPVYAVDVKKNAMSRSAILSASGDCDVRLWSSAGGENGSSWESVCVFKRHERPVWDVSFSPVNHHCGFFFASASADRTACVWALDRPYPVRVYRHHASDVERVEIHPNGRVLAAGLGNGDVRIYDIRDEQKKDTGSVQAAMRSNTGPVCAMAFSANGRYLAVGGEGLDVVVWDLVSLSKPLAVFSGHEDTVHSVHFSRDGEMLATGSSDCTVKLWSMSAFNRSRPGASAVAVDRPRFRSMSKAATSPNLLQSLATKATPVYNVRFNNKNLLMVAGAYLPIEAARAHKRF